MEQCGTAWLNSGTVWQSVVEKCGMVWWNSVERYGERVEQYGGIVEQCGRVWWKRATVEQCGGTV